MCANCAQHFVQPELAENSYGEFLLRTPSGEWAYLDAMADASYKEVDSLLSSNSRTAHLSDAERCVCLMHIYGKVACDPASDGTVFVLAAFPPCPNCGSQEMASWEYLNPAQVVDEEVPNVTHTRWATLSAAQKAVLVEAALAA